MTNVYETHPALQLYRSMADLLHSNSPWRLDFEDEVYPTHTIPAVELKAVALANLKSLYDAVMRAGWNTHTNDWDWFVHITMANGEEYVGVNGSWQFADGGRQVVPWENVTACVEAGPGAIVYIQFWVYEDSEGEPLEEEQVVYLPIADFAGIYFAEEH